ncbi:MAG: signal peptidase II [Planctomycetales bacterium]
MKPLPASRCALFLGLALAAAAGDLYSKHVVFRDLGYPARVLVPDRPGLHEIFQPGTDPAGRVVEGESAPYLEGWLEFRLYTSFNEGALWGVGQGWTWLFASLSVLAIAGVTYWLFVRKAAASAWLTVALAFITGGTLGNLFDRLGLHGCQAVDTGATRHAVRDFLLFTFGGWNWPVFNFADAFLVTGAIMLVLQSFLLPERKEPERS